MDIRDIKRRVIEARERREAYKIDGVGGARPDVVDPRLLAHYTTVTELVGIDDARDELIKVLTDDGSQEASKQHGRVVSIVGCGGLGKTTLANVVYQKIRTQFDCWAFVSVSQTPDMRRLFEGILSELGKDINEETRDVRHFIDAIGKFLQTKR
jgi:Holliday junction resolvasome RuvABC ATP-dependent DNA helicase subunit